MALLDEARRLAASGDLQAATDLISRAAAGGDPDALLQLGQWRMLGLNGLRDLSAAHELLGAAGARGNADAIRLQATLIGNGTGCPADPAKAAAMLKRIAPNDAYAALQLGFAEKMLTDAAAARLPVEVLSQQPSIRVIRSLLTPEECRYLMVLAEPHLQPSFVIDPRTGGRIPHPVRTSSGMSFGPPQEDLIVNRINRRLALVTGTETGWGEPLHVLRYAPGQEYRPHVDALPGVANQRHWTVLLYLNHGYGGGGTRFDQAGVEFSGREGDALIFRNVDEQGRGDPTTRHAGLPVTSGTKWLATRWIRCGPYHPWEADG